MSVSIRDFVVSKAKNMKVMLEPFIKTPEHKELLLKYNENDIESITHTYLAPLYATGTLDVAKNTLIESLNITDESVKDKIGRYLLCFCESMLVKS
jgi:hypothetical protein